MWPLIFNPTQSNEIMVKRMKQAKYLLCIVLVSSKYLLVDKIHIPAVLGLFQTLRWTAGMPFLVFKVHDWYSCDLHAS